MKALFELDIPSIQNLSSPTVPSSILNPLLQYCIRTAALVVLIEISAAIISNNDIPLLFLRSFSLYFVDSVYYMVQFKAPTSHARKFIVVKKQTSPIIDKYGSVF